MDDACIGLMYNISESRWVWVNGQSADNSEILWAPGQPDFDNVQDFSGSGSGELELNIINDQDYCIAIKYSDDPSNNGRAIVKYDKKYHNFRYYLCEWKNW